MAMDEDRIQKHLEFKTIIICTWLNMDINELSDQVIAAVAEECLNYAHFIDSSILCILRFYISLMFLPT